MGAVKAIFTDIQCSMWSVADNLNRAAELGEPEDMALAMRGAILVLNSNLAMLIKWTSPEDRGDTPSEGLTQQASRDSISTLDHGRGQDDE